MSVGRRRLLARARPDAPSDGRPNRATTVLLAIQAALAICACESLLRGVRTAPLWVLAVDASVLAAWLGVTGYRRWLKTIVAAEWNSAESYSRGIGPAPWRAALLLVAAPCLGVLLLREGGIKSGDSRPVVLAAASLLADGDMELSEFVASYTSRGLYTRDGKPPYFFQNTNCGTYSAYPAGMVPFALPVVLAGKLTTADLADPEVHSRMEWLGACSVAAACASLFFLLALRLVDVAPALFATGVLSLGSAMYSSVAQALWQHGGVILGTEMLLLCEFCTWRRPTSLSIFVQGAACAMMCACRPSAAVLAVCFGIWVVLRDPRRAVAIAAASGLAFAPWAAWHNTIYGSLCGPSWAQTAGHNWRAANLASWARLLVSPSHGLLIYQPWLVLSLLWAVPAVRRGSEAAGDVDLPPGWAAFALAGGALHLVLISHWWCWWGGWCWGSRLATESLPLLMLLCVKPLGVMWSNLGGRQCLYGLALVSVLLHVPSVFLRQDRWSGSRGVDAHPEKLDCWADPPFLYPLLGK